MYSHHLTGLIQWLSRIFVGGEIKKYVSFVEYMEGSIDFTNPTYFYVRFGTDQISNNIHIMLCGAIINSNSLRM